MAVGINGVVQKGFNCIDCPQRSRMMCASMPTELLTQLGGIAHRMKVTKGSSLFYEGDDADFVYNVTEGFLRLTRVGVDGRRQVLGFLTTGDYLGHTRKEQYSLSAEALTDVRVCRFARGALEALLHKSPAMEHQFHLMTAGLLDDMLDLVFTLGRKNAMERVASFLVHFCDRQSVSDMPLRDIKLPMTRADIADFLGLTLETVSRAFSRLKRDGVIDIEHAHTIRLLDRGRLIEMSAGELDMAAQ